MRRAKIGLFEHSDWGMWEITCCDGSGWIVKGDVRW